MPSVFILITVQAYFSSKQYRRALMVLKRGDMHERELRCKYLAARCLAECKDWEECLSMLGDGNNVDCLNSSLFSDSRVSATDQGHAPFNRES